MSNSSVENVTEKTGEYTAHQPSSRLVWWGIVALYLGIFALLVSLYWIFL